MTDIQSIAMLVASATLFVASVARAASFCTHRNPGSLSVAIALASLAASMFVFTPSVYRFLDLHVFHRSDTSMLVGQLAVVVSAWTATDFIAALTRERVTFNKKLAASALLTASLMAVLFLVHPWAVETYNVTETFGRDWTLDAYWFLFLGYVCTLLCVVMGMTLRGSEHSDEWLRRGLLMIGAGAACGIAYLMQWAAELVLLRIGDAASRSASDAAIAVGIFAAILIAIGTSLPSLAPSVEARAARRRIRPLWQELTQYYPSVRLPSQISTDHLLRMVIEIRDAATEASAARDHRCAEVADRVLSLPARELLELDAEVDMLGGLADGLSRGRRRVA